MPGVEEWLSGMPLTLIYILVGAIISLESMGIPLPGEITLVSAALLAATGMTNVWGVALAAAFGAIVGDSIGYAVGHRGGRALLIRAGRRFPKHLGPAHLARAEGVLERWGVWAVFFGRFVALLRILAGPLSGALRVSYHKFVLANATGGLVWAFGTTLVVFHAGRAAERYLKGFSWVALAAAAGCGICTTVYLKRRAMRAQALVEAGDTSLQPSPIDEIAALATEAARDIPAGTRSIPAASRSEPLRPAVSHPLVPHPLVPHPLVPHRFRGLLRASLPAWLRTSVWTLLRTSFRAHAPSRTPTRRS